MLFSILTNKLHITANSNWYVLNIELENTTEIHRKIYALTHAVMLSPLTLTLNFFEASREIVRRMLCTDVSRDVVTTGSAGVPIAKCLHA